MPESEWNTWADLARDWPDPRQRREQRYGWATLLVLLGAAVIAEVRGYTIPELEAAEVAPLQKRISELEAALRAAQVDQQRLADADALVKALKELLAA